jgi:hypothetical protein
VENTFANFKRRLLTCDLGGVLFADVTKDLIERFAVDCRLQRIDSVHLSSNMKKAGRLAIMSATVEKFLNHLRRRCPRAFEAVDPGLVETYLPDKPGQCFGKHVKPSERETAMLAVATDIYGLVVQFESDPEVAEMERYKILARVLDDQCDVKRDGRPLGRLKEGADALIRADRDTFEDWGEDLEDNPPNEIAMKDPKDVSSGSLQFPTDPDASFSGHKGKGYQAQIVETVVASDDPEVKKRSLNLIVHVEVEGAAKSDAAALRPAVDHLVENDLKPEKLLADTLYGGQENYEYAAANGIELVAPAPGKEGTSKVVMNEERRDSARNNPAMAQSTSFTHDAGDRIETMEDETEPPKTGEAKPFRLSDFDRGEDGEIMGCPMGAGRLGILENGDNRRVAFPLSTCLGCPRRGDCPVKVSKKKAWLCYGKRELGLAIRRANEDSDEFADQYRWRAGIEATNSCLARLGLKRLRVRGLKKVKLKVMLKALGLNIKRAVSFMTRNAWELVVG